ncbi:hypothetical protein [Paraburkholderia hospita]|uniref:hypothetical protein n=1 Tax=Paraburkholderia hospita TaxID=169430 RepID=UPI000B343DDA|nr:hypothetical protein [Paraburkholderia hospita]OUL82342.1 hypothetical protein CA603_28520 [Paraburkholderia hospita]
MRIFFSVLPTVLLVAYSQIIIKWRVVSLQVIAEKYGSGVHKYLFYLFDPFVISAYVAGLVGSFAWLFIVAKLPLALAFSVYQGLTFAIVLLASTLILGEPMTSSKLMGIFMILGGVIVGTRG